MKLQPYRYLSPIGKMSEFLDEALSGDYFTAFMSSANGTGKTVTIAALIANISFPNDNPFFQHDMIQNWEWERRGRVVSEPSTMTDVIIPELEKMLPDGGSFTRSKGGKKYYSKWKMRDKDGKVVFQWDFMTYEQNLKQFESANLGIVIFDEPPPYSIYTASLARLKLGGVCLIFATPLSDNIGSAWLYQTIASPADMKEMEFFYMTASKRDACEDHGVRGFLPHDQIEREVKSYPADQLLPRVFGEFSQVKGRVVKEYNEEIHVLDKTFPVDAEDYSVIQLWDTHPRVNEAILWVATNSKGVAFVVDELWIDMESGLDNMVSKIKEIDKQYRVVKRLLDPAGFVEDKRFAEFGNVTGLSFAMILQQKYGLKYEPASKRRTEGINMMREALRYNYQGGTWHKKPMLYVFPHCTRTRWEFLNWMWDEWRGPSAENKKLSGKPKDLNDHFMENLGRNFLSGIGWVEPTRELPVMTVRAGKKLVEQKIY